MNIKVIRRADQGRLAKIRAARKQGVEGPEIGIIRAVIPARDVRLDSESRFKRSMFQRESNIRSRGPGLNVAVAEAAELIHELEVIVPTRHSSPEARADGVPQFIGRPLVEARVLPIQAEIIKVNIATRQPGNRSDGIKAPEILVWIRIIVEHTRPGSHRLGGESVHLPIPDFQDRLQAVKAETHVWRFPNRNQSG